MRSFVQLFDLLSGNFVADFAFEDEAWSELRRWAAESGPEELRGFSLMRYIDGHPTLIAMEDELVRRAIGDNAELDSGTYDGAKELRLPS